MKHWAAATCLLLAAAPCRADEAPVLKPVRDVDVVYLIVRGSQQVQERSRWQAATGKQRIDVAGTASYMISDHRGGLVDMVNASTRQVMEMQLPPAAPDQPAAAYTRLGVQTIAGIACTDWQLAGPQPVVLCLSADGVTLGLRGQDGQLVRAISVNYAPSDVAAFAVPDGYRKSTPQPDAPAAPVP